jgi:hypothetical protein
MCNCHSNIQNINLRFHIIIQTQKSHFVSKKLRFKVYVPVVMYRVLYVHEGWFLFLSKDLQGSCEYVK